MNSGFFKLHEVFKKKILNTQNFFLVFHLPPSLFNLRYLIYSQRVHFFNLLNKCIVDSIINLVNTKDSKRNERIPQVLLPSHSNQPQNLRLSWLSQAHINTNKTLRESWQVSPVVSEYFPLGKASSTTAWLFLFYLQSKLNIWKKSLSFSNIGVLRGLKKIGKIRSPQTCLSRLEN